MPNSIKIHAYLAQLGVASRRKSEELVADGKVTVNGETAHVGQRVIPGKDSIQLEGKELSAGATDFVYILLHKPRGYVSTSSDELGRKSVVDLIPDQYGRVYPVGRLDKDSEGLLLLTNDGNTAYVLTHPKFEVTKTYEILIDGVPSTPALNHLRKGIQLKEGFVQPKAIEILGHEEQKRTWLSITITEGHNQQVRRMLRRTGYEVLRLRRVTMGPLALKNLQIGQFRKLKTQEIEQLTNYIKNIQNRTK